MLLDPLPWVTAPILPEPAGEVRDGPARRICAITGTNGYVGSRVTHQLANAGWHIRALSRTRASQKQSRVTQVHFELGDELEPRALEGVDALVHSAYDFSATRWCEIEYVNIEGSRRLFTAAREAGVDRIVFLSTIAAFPGAPSLYGRAKLEIERAALDAGATIIRPGLVWGPRGAAMFGSLQQVVERLPIVPQPVPAELELRLVHEDDLATLVQRILERWPESAEKLFVAASGQALRFADLLRSLALRAGKRPLFVRLPWRVAWIGLRALEAVGVPPPFSSDNLVSIMAADGHSLTRATDDAERYGVRFRSYTLV